MGSDTLFQTFITLLEAFQETIFNNSVGADVAFAATSSALTNHCPFRTFFFFRVETGKYEVGTSLGNVADAPARVIRVSLYSEVSIFGTKCATA
jgi:hypothetical protein